MTLDYTFKVTLESAEDNISFTITKTDSSHSLSWLMNRISEYAEEFKDERRKRDYADCIETKWTMSWETESLTGNEGITGNFVWHGEGEYKEFEWGIYENAFELWEQMNQAQLISLRQYLTGTCDGCGRPFIGSDV